MIGFNSKIRKIMFCASVALGLSTSTVCSVNAAWYYHFPLGRFGNYNYTSSEVKTTDVDNVGVFVSSYNGTDKSAVYFREYTYSTYVTVTYTHYLSGNCSYTLNFKPGYDLSAGNLLQMGARNYYMDSSDYATGNYSVNYK